MPFKIVRNDITKMDVDAVVNTANPKVKYGPGIDTAIYKAAGEEALLSFRREIGCLEEGDVVITPGLGLKAKYIIHAVSPLYHDGNSGEEELLRACYRKSLELAGDEGCKSMAFPLISTGCFQYPKAEGLRIAIDEIHAYLINHEMLIYLVVFDAEATKLSMNLYPDLDAYIDNNYVDMQSALEYCQINSFVTDRPRKSPASVGVRVDNISEASIEGAASIDDLDAILEEQENAINERMKHLADSYQQYLFYLIESKGLSNAEVYKRAIITKQTFSKIKNNIDYHPDKATAMRLCVGAMLSLDETKDLLARAGYALSPSNKRDVIFSFFIERGIFDMIEIDIALEDHGLPCFIE